MICCCSCWGRGLRWILGYEDMRFVACLKDLFSDSALFSSDALKLLLLCEDVMHAVI